MPRKKSGKGDQTRKRSAPVRASSGHALDRMHFWGGVSVLILAGVMAVSDVSSTLFMGAGLGGLLAMLLE